MVDSSELEITGEHTLTPFHLLKEYVIDFEKVKTIEHLLQILKVSNVSFVGTHYKELFDAGLLKEKT